MTALDRFVAWFVGHDLLIVVAAAFLVLGAAAEAGFRLGRQRAARRPASEADIGGIATLSAGMLSLLAFTLALTITFAQNRFESRRDDVVREANAIGTAWLRAGLAAQPGGAALADGIRAYAQLRLDYALGVPRPAEAALNARTAVAQAQLWQTTAALARADPGPMSASLVAAINDMFDAALAQRFAVESRVPVRLVFLLLAGSLLCFAAMGFQFGLRGQRHAGVALMLLLMWTGALGLIVDFSDPRQGALGINTAPLQWTLQGMGNRP